MLQSNQKQTTELYVLLAEYKDVENEPSAPYMKQVDVDFSRNSLPETYKKLFDELEFFQYEKADRYYDIKNLDCVAFPYKTTDYPGPYYTILAQLHSKGFENWRDVIDEDHETMKWRGMDLKKDIVAKCEERNRIDTPQLKVHTVLFAHDDTISTANGIIEFNSTGLNNKKHSFKVLNDIKSLYEWFVENRLPLREFVICEKHGENGKTHIYFENQRTSPVSSFHGYHIKEGDKGFEKIDHEKLSMICQ